MQSFPPLAIVPQQEFPPPAIVPQQGEIVEEPQANLPPIFVRSYPVAPAERVSCPFCGESILAIAKKCKHCGEILDVTLRALDEAKRAAEAASRRDRSVNVQQVVTTVVKQKQDSGLMGCLLLFLVVAFFAFCVLPGLLRR
jgi:hypothetical protein